MFEFEIGVISDCNTGAKYCMNNPADLIEAITIANINEINRNRRVESLKEYIDGMIDGVSRYKAKVESKGEPTDFLDGYLQALKRVRELAFDEGIYSVE